MYPKVTGFVKTISVDRGSRVRAGDVLATLEAPELPVATRGGAIEAAGAEAQLAAARAKADADTSTYRQAESRVGDARRRRRQRRRCVAQKAVEADQSQIAAAEQTRRGRTAGVAVGHRDGGLPESRRALRRRRHGAQRPSRSARRARQAAPAPAMPMLRAVRRSIGCVWSSRCPRRTPRRHARRRTDVHRAGVSGRTFSGTIARVAQAVDVKTRTMAVELDVANGDGRLAPGTFCQVRWPVHRAAPSLFVPSGEHREHDRSHVCHPGPKREDGVGGREDRSCVRRSGRGVRRTSTGR